eukprot:1150750-Pelagomonas_calceolata.AAC.2
MKLRDSHAGKRVVYKFHEESLTYGVGNSSTFRLIKTFAVSERAVDAYSNFLFAILDMTAIIRVRPCPPVRDFEHEGWTRLDRGEALALFGFESRHVGIWILASVFQIICNDCNDL